MKFKDIRAEVCEANKELDKNNLLFMDKGGASAIDRPQGVVVVKPAEIPHACLTPDDMLVLDFSGNVVAGSLTVSPDTLTHLALYQSYPQLGGIVTTYGRYATLFAQAERPIPCLGVLHAGCFKGEIPVTRVLRKPEVERNYGKSIGGVIVERLARLDPMDMPGILVARHGAMSWGKTVRAAAWNSLALEQIARLAFGTLQLVPQMAPLSGMLLDRHLGGQ